MRIQGIDLVAAIAIPCFSALIYAGHDGMVISLLATIVGYYFGKKSSKAEKES